MYAKDRTNLRILHPLDTTKTKKMPEHGPSMSDSQDLDPFGKRVWSVIFEALKLQEQITIKDICDALEESGFQVSDSVVRERVADFVDDGYLDCLPGAGRRPSFYCLPEEGGAPILRQVEYATPDDADALKHLLSSEAKLLTDMSALQEQLRAKESEIETLQQDIEALRRSVKVKIRLAQSEQGGN